MIIILNEFYYYSSINSDLIFKTTNIYSIYNQSIYYFVHIFFINNYKIKNNYIKNLKIIIKMQCIINYQI